MSRAPLTPLEDALAAVLAQAQPLPGAAFVDLLQADGRVLAADCIAPLQVPPLDNSAMDGYAVRSAEVAQAGTVLPVSQRIPAGQVGTALQVGTVARIFTGAPLPPGADAIVMQEDCTVLDDGRVRFDAVPQPGQFVRRAGQDIALGSTALQAGLRLTPAALGLAASLGLAQLPVARRPRVALFSTGDELALPGSIAPQDLPPGHIFNSNLARRPGGHPRRPGPGGAGLRPAGDQRRCVGGRRRPCAPGGRAAGGAVAVEDCHEAGQALCLWPRAPQQ